MSSYSQHFTFLQTLGNQVLNELSQSLWKLWSYHLLLLISLFQLRLQIFTCFHFKFPTVLLSWNWAICHIMSMFGLCSNPDFSVSPILNFYYFAAITSAIQVLAHCSFVPPACFVGWYLNNQLEKIWNKAVTNQSEVLSCIFLQRQKNHDCREFCVSSDLNCAFVQEWVLQYKPTCPATWFTCFPFTSQLVEFPILWNTYVS